MTGYNCYTRVSYQHLIPHALCTSPRHDLLTSPSLPTLYAATDPSKDNLAGFVGLLIRNNSSELHKQPNIRNVPTMLWSISI